MAVGDFYISTTGTTRTINTGNNLAIVGLGFSGQIIVWGYDLNMTQALAATVIGATGTMAIPAAMLVLPLISLPLGGATCYLR